ncbi:hypothetical protein Nepgr_007542 [Nepenthes gracilis]|uniref:Photosynthetic NDH subcomplex L 3 n=1 Tax=Nepenthes gracilis TaxID=150966 RepID=A0AAD3S805_NEPGR|nr:hypothetical protein Nepgr_007542 [Nepenthes gracilis]
MARLANFYGVPETLSPAVPKIPNIQTTRRRARIIECAGDNLQGTQENSPLTTRRRAIAIASAALLVQSGAGASLAEDNGLWITGPIPVPHAANKIANEETGTRNFLKPQIFMADIGAKGSAYRLRKCAFDLLALGDLIGQDAWPYIRRYLRLKSTFMYFDFDRVISAAPMDDKPLLMELANRLFDNFEKLFDAVKEHDFAKTEARYRDTTMILQEVMDRMA